LLKCPQEDIVFKQGFAYSWKNKSSSMTMKALAKECFANKIHLAAQGWFHAPKCEWDDKTGLGDAYYTYSYMTHVAEVEVCKITGQVRVNKITAVHDIGTVINPAAAVAQVQGGVAQGIGYSVFEGFKLKEGLPVTRNFATYILPTAKDVPDVDVHFVEERESHGPYGAKSLGEPPIIPVGAAIANAVYHATGVRIRELPLLPELVWKAMKHKKEESS
jgi:CO/xanthine dehydrogenase Mo-binding subunit